MATEYRIVFAGAILDGLEVETVKQAARQRLKISADQFERIFSGKPVILKKGLSSDTSERYMSELTRIGMKVHCEPMEALALVPAPETPVMEQQGSATSSPAPRPNTTASTGANRADTMIMPAAQLAAFAPSAADQAPANMGNRNAERTLIASPDALAAYLAANSGSDPVAHMVVTNIKQPEVLADHMESMQAVAAPANPSPFRTQGIAPRGAVQTPAATSPANENGQPKSQQAAVNAAASAQPAVILSSSFSARDNDEMEVTPTAAQSGLWPKLLLALVGLGGISLLGLVIWIIAT